MTHIIKTPGNSLGLTINLPLGQRTNKYIQKEINFYYFFVRKVCLAFSAEAFIFYPGGFGTLDEFYELITLIQTRKIKGVPLICVGSEYWNKLKDFMKEKMLNRGAVAIIMEIIRKVPVRSSIPFSNHENKEF
ncbi:MAG: LOG family protein [Candidatus Zambryskibacteria bacterium]|nr:LOG family protein [Candidatus Zambryskibacteria bacterium]